MSKRTKSKLSGPEKDYWRTPPEPVEKLMPHITDVVAFCECCAGDGALVSLLAERGKLPAESYDIRPRHWSVARADCTRRTPCYPVITNPPYSRAALMPIMDAAVRWPVASWWLVPWDMLSNGYFAPVRPHVAAAVPVGRVSWVRNADGSPTGPGFENYGWIKLTDKEQGWLK